MDLLTPSSPGGLPTLSLTTPGYLGGGLPCLSSALWCQYPKQELGYRWQTALRVYRSVKVTKHGTIRCVRYVDLHIIQQETQLWRYNMNNNMILLVCYSNFVPKTRHFLDIGLQKCIMICRLICATWIYL